MGLFYYDLVDKQILGTVSNVFFGPLPILANIPKSRVYGFDADVTLRPATGLTLRGAVNYSNTRTKSHMTLPRYDGVLLDIYGSPFPFAPKWNATR
jgi:iron complex outermembrane recepter protein